MVRKGNGGEGAKPLAGIKVLDLAWVATVARVESERRPNIMRAALGHRDDIPDQENAITWHVANAGKMGLALNLAKPEAREVIKDLARWADLVTESFTPGTMAKMGLGYDVMSAINPGLVMLSSCVMGQSGPLANKVAGPWGGGPPGGRSLCQHSHDVLHGILGCDDDRIAELAIAEALE